jgi:hypothetical protein
MDSGGRSSSRKRRSWRLAGDALSPAGDGRLGERPQGARGQGHDARCRRSPGVRRGGAKAAIRQNGKATLPTCVAASIAVQNGIDLPVTPAVGMRSLHPNHLHQVDPSLCLVYYDRGQQIVIRDDEFYKNKLQPEAREAKNKVWRYVLTDHTSGTIIPYYISAKGESQKNLFEFLMFAWSKQRRSPVPRRAEDADDGPGQRQHRPLDPQPAALAAGRARRQQAAQRACEGLGRERAEHRRDPLREPAALPPGEQRRGDERRSVRLGERVQREPHPAARHAPASRRHRAAARYDLWLRVRADELRELPARELCLNLLLGAKGERKVTQKLRSRTSIPQLERSRLRPLGLARHLRRRRGRGVADGVRPRPHHRARASATTARNSSTASSRSATSTNTASAPPRRSSARATARTRTPRPSRPASSSTAWPTAIAPLEEIQRAKDKNAQPFAHFNDGRGVDSLDYLKTRSRRRPTCRARARSSRCRSERPSRRWRSSCAAISTPKATRSTCPAHRARLAPLGHVDAAMRLRALLGDAWTAEMFARWRSSIRTACREDELQLAAESLMGKEVEAPARGICAR